MEGAHIFQKTRNNRKLPSIGLDLIGGEHSSIEHVLETLKKIYDSKIGKAFNLTLFSIPEHLSKINNFRTSRRLSTESLNIIESKEVISMNDNPLHAVRIKKNASMCIGVRYLNEKKIDAFLTTGNTGALIASTKMHLPMLPGISRAALVTLLPTKKDPIAVIDVGANIQCNPNWLVQFAEMGTAFQKSRGINNPSIGLLNIGTEEKKGSAELYETYQMLQNNPAFIGNIEGKEVFSGNIQVLVTDGFTGNIFIKTAEGLSSFILDSIHQNKKLFNCFNFFLKRLEKKLHSQQYPGAILCGVNGIIMKCHGDAKPNAIQSGIEETLRLIKYSFLEKIKLQLSLV